MGIVLLISVAKLCICYLMSKLSKFERSHSLTAELASGALKIFLSQFINAVPPILFSSSGRRHLLGKLESGVRSAEHLPDLEGQVPRIHGGMVQDRRYNNRNTAILYRIVDFIHGNKCGLIADHRAAHLLLEPTEALL